MKERGVGHNNSLLARYSFRVLSNLYNLVFGKIPFPVTAPAPTDDRLSQALDMEIPTYYRLKSSVNGSIRNKVRSQVLHSLDSIDTASYFRYHSHLCTIACHPRKPTRLLSSSTTPFHI